MLSVEEMARRDKVSGAGYLLVKLLDECPVHEPRIVILGLASAGTPLYQGAADVVEIAVSLGPLDHIPFAAAPAHKQPGQQEYRFLAGRTLRRGPHRQSCLHLAEHFLGYDARPGILYSHRRKGFHSLPSPPPHQRPGIRFVSQDPM